MIFWSPAGFLFKWSDIWLWRRSSFQLLIHMAWHVRRKDKNIAWGLCNDVLDTIARKLNLTPERKKYICNPIALQRGPNNVCERTLQNFLAGKFRFLIAPLWYFQLCCNPSDLDIVGPISLHWWLVHTCWGPRSQQRWGTSWRSGWWRRQRCRRPGGSELRTEL